MSMEDVPLRISSDERDFEMEESDFLLQPPDHRIRSSSLRYRSSRRWSSCLTFLFCGNAGVCDTSQVGSTLTTLPQ